MKHSEGKTVVFVALLANAVIATAKYIVAALSGSASLLSEAIHSTVDTGNQALLLLGRKRSQRPADTEHPFGHGLELYFWTLIVAVLLFGVGGGMSIYEGVHELVGAKAERSHLSWTLIVLGVAAVSEGISWRVASRHLRSQRQGRTLWRTIREVKDPQLITVFLEDSAALLGIAFAATGVVLTHLTGSHVYDGVAAILIGITLCGVATFLALETRTLLMGEAALKKTVERIQRELSEDEAVERVGVPLTMHFSPDEILVNLEVEFKDKLSAHELAEATDRMEATVRDIEPRAKRIFIEARALHGR